MPNTTNFNFPTPADTDLVKDGASAIRSLGNSIDTAFVDLKGGTTGQVLSKASNTDLDYTWVTTDDANAIQNAIVDAKGDLIAASAADTPARLAVGNNGETLVADSSASVGLRYQEPKAGNPVVNSAFQVWQRGTSFSGSSLNAYTADRWQGYRSSNITITRQTTSDTTNLPNIQYCARVQRDSGNTNTSILYLTQSFETVNSIPFAGKTITLSFYARAGANYSSASNALTVQLSTGTGTDQNVINGFTGTTNPISQNVTLTTTWQRFAISASIPSTATQIALNFNNTPVGTAGAADYFEITGVQLEVGSVATPFKTQGVTLAGELAACMRYAEKVEYTGSTVLTVGQAYSTTAAWGGISWTTQKRTTPTITQTGTIQALQANTGTSGTTFAYSTLGTNNARMDHSGGSSLTAGNAVIFQASGTVSLLITAEL